jgi:SAM-dependent methyltransferase
VISLSGRSALPEELDDETTHPDDYRRCMAELAFINRLTLTHRPTLQWLTTATQNLPAGAAFSVLDVGYGDGDLLRAIAHWADERGFKVQLSGIDPNPRSAETAIAATPPWRANIDYQTGDVFYYVPRVPADFIVSSQFAHHLSDDDVVEFLAWIDKSSIRGWHIADLHRHRFAYHGFPILCRLAGWHHITRSDGTISIARGFRRKDWRALLDKAGVRATISWHMAFRFCVSRVKV